MPAGVYYESGGELGLLTCVWLFNTIKELVLYFCLPPPTTDAWLKKLGDWFQVSLHTIHTGSEKFVCYGGVCAVRMHFTDCFCLDLHFHGKTCMHHLSAALPGV